MSYYIFNNVYVNNEYYGVIHVDIASVEKCKYSDWPESYIVKYSRNAEAMIINVNSRNKDFENMFPEFPYKKKLSKIEFQQNKFDKIEKRVNKTEKRIDKIENDITKLLSHVEAIMTVLQQRLPTDEPLML